MTTTNIEVDTRPQAGAESVKTTLTIDWTECTEDDLRAMAQQALIVKLQGAWRKNGIPNGEHTVKAADYKVGVRTPKTKQTVESMLAALSPDDRAALLAKYRQD